RFIDLFDAYAAARTTREERRRLVASLAADALRLHAKRPADAGHASVLARLAGIEPLFALPVARRAAREVAARLVAAWRHRRAGGEHA
ncbi:MAG: hypothetical protein ACT4PT_08955, partial [Methanobacteriota archaeon]